MSEINPITGLSMSCEICYDYIVQAVKRGTLNPYLCKDHCHHYLTPHKNKHLRDWIACQWEKCNGFDCPSGQYHNADDPWDLEVIEEDLALSDSKLGKIQKE